MNRNMKYENNINLEGNNSFNGSGSMMKFQFSDKVLMIFKILIRDEQ